MQQQKITLEQLAEEVADFLEPVIPCLVIGSKRSDEEAGKKAGPEVWEARKKLWEKLFSENHPELREAAEDMVVASSNSEVKQALTREILKVLKQNPDLALEISHFTEGEEIKKMIEEYSTGLKIQNLNNRKKVFEEFNKMLEEFMSKKIIAQALEMAEDETDPSMSGVIPEVGINVKKLKSPYTHIQLTQEIQTEGTPSSIRMAKIAEMHIKGQSEIQRFQSQLSVLSELEGPEKEEFMEKILGFASGIEYGDLRSQALSMLIPYLEEPRRAELIEKALCSASRIQDEEERALVLRSLAPHLRGPGKERLIEDILAFALYIQYSDSKFQILSSIIPHLFGSKNEKIMEKALELSYSIQSEYLRGQSLSLLIPYLNGQRKEEIIDEALQLAFNLKDKDMRPEALSFIIPYLDGVRKEEVLKKALELAKGIKSEYRREQALSSLSFLS
ncbi:MAG: hypothetical protein AAGU10_02395 [Methanosarcina mazei]